jgi:RNA polymerase-binding transcription factor DksA
MIDTNKYKIILEAELKKVEGELGTVAQKNPSVKNDWQAVATNLEDADDESDPNDNADKIEEFETNVAITEDLEIRFTEIKEALKRIEDGTYGKCSVDGEEIPEERLNANPAAKNCIKHS